MRWAFSPESFRMHQTWGVAPGYYAAAPLVLEYGRIQRAACYTGTLGNFQMSFAYSLMVRSLENFPIRAVFRMAIRAQWA
jgi:hypothetical protein